MASIGTLEAFDCLKKRIERLEDWKRKVVRQMSDLTKGVQEVADSEQALEDRETAKAAHQAEVDAAFAAQIADLETRLGEQDAAVVGLKAIKAKLDAFGAGSPPSP